MSDPNPAKKPRKKYSTCKERKEHAISKLTRNQETWGPRPDVDQANKEPRKPKKKCAILLGFVGTGYNGMQINPGVKTIESDLFKALCEVGAISKDNSDDPKKSGLMRAARTDKGVHAAGMVVNIKIITNIDNLIEKLNEALPPQIRVIDIHPVMNSFHSKTFCSGRIYEYLLPSYVLAPPDSLPKIEFDMNSPIPKLGEEELAEVRKFKASNELLDKFNQVLAHYQGTKSYHNYSPYRYFGEASSKRVMRTFDVNKIFEEDGCEWILLRVEGDSFMLNQIRKMVSLAVLVTRSGVDSSLMEKSFENRKFNIPNAPSLGLYLERTMFANYKAKLEKTNSELPDLDFKLHEDKLNKIKDEMILPTIIKEEQETQDFVTFCYNVDYRMHNYPWLTSDGTIPELGTAVKPKNTQDAKDKPEEPVKNDEDADYEAGNRSD